MARLCITTPEQVHFHYEVGGLVSRAVAWLLDQVILTIARVAVVLVVWGRGGHVGAAVVLLAVFVLDFGYYLYFELRAAGRSPGKRVLHLRVISARGGRLRFADVLVRNLLRPVDTLPAAMLLGGVVAFVDPLRRRLGDLAAETVVVREAPVALPQALVAQQARANTFQADPAIRGRILARVTRDERDLILDLMMRRDDLEPSVREELFRSAADYFRSRYSLPQDLDYLSDEQTVLNLALVIQGAKFAG
ncbi:MAG: RDD family protein [Candidatus Brocadiia bacterium]